MWRAAVALSLTLVVAAGKDADDFSLAICGAAPDGSRVSADTLAAVAALAVQATGVGAHVSRECFQPPNLAPSYTKTIRNLTSTTQPHAHVALLVVSATSPPSAPLLEEVGLEQLGDAAPPWRRACLVSNPPARSLLDFADPTLAAVYHMPPEVLHAILKYKQNIDFTVTPDWCKSPNSTCATMLTSNEVERDILAQVVNQHRLYAAVHAVGAALAEAAAVARPLLVCDSAVELSPLARFNLTPLGPPPCHGTDACPFEPLRLIKIANVKSLLKYRSAQKALIRLHFDTSELVNLTIDARINGPEKAANAFIRKHPFIVLPDEVRVAVLVPKNTTRDTYEFRSFEEAAKLVEKSFSASQRPRFKVQVIDDRCSGQKTYQFLTNSVGTGEYGALSAVAGPACGEAFEKMADLALLHVLPMLAYTPQAPPRAAGGLALLAAGDARRNNDLWFALLSTMKWRRLAVLSEKATYESLSRLSNFSIYQLHDDNDSVDKKSITQWAIKTAEENFKILYPCLEDARKVRAAMCAGHAAGLTPRQGAVWLLPSALPADWARPAAGEEPGCSPEELAEMREGHLRSAPAWEAEWPPARRYEWARICPNCDPSAALLYDVLKLWAATVLQLINAEPTALNDLHQFEYLKSIIINITTSTNYTGLTGRFEWTFADGAYARSIPHVVQQWRNGSYETVGRWENGLLSLKVEALRWGTDDGQTPHDGSDHCGLQPLAQLLGSDCRTAFIVLAALLLSVLVGALAAFALYCRRRAEREYRAHLEALRLRTFGLKPGGLDRWEVPRERVVINRKLGTGAFGTVYGGHALLAEDRGWTAVAVKTLKAGASTEEKLDFLSEAEAMKRFDHKNVVRLLAVVTKTEPVCTVMEFMLYGDLKNYLLARRHLATETGMGAYGDEAAEEVSPRRLTAMALDAARALSYLAQLRYVHRDVAARNCLVSAHRVVKLADFGMTRLVFENDYYRFSRKGMLPVRWMAPESLALGVFSPASDVWSFGVLLYEIVTFGSLPFQGLSNSEVLGRVKAGHTLDLPTGLKPQLEGLIKSCWRQEAKARPMAAEVAAFLADSPRLLAPCLDVPLDALPLDPDPPWRAARDRAEARWVSWAAPASATTDTTYLSADARPPSETDAFLAAPATP